MAGKKSFGVTVSIGATLIGGLTNASNSGGDVNFIDTTTHDSEGGWKEFVGGLIDGGTFDIEGNYDLTDAGQLALVTGIATTVAVIMTFSDGSTAECDAIIGKYDVGNELDGVITFTCPLKVTGPITRTA
jgi:predicted secreted protein